MTSEAETLGGRPPISDSEIIERFGGIRPMASKLGVAVTTVQGWKERDHIPDGRMAQIVKAAAEHDIDIGMTAAPPDDARRAEAKAEAEPEPAAVKAEAPMEPRDEAAPEPKAETKVETKPAPTPPEGEAGAAEEGGVRPARGGGVPWIALIVVVVFLGAAIATVPLWQAKLYPGGAAGLSPAASGRLDNIDAGLSSIRETVQGLKRDLDSQQKELSGRIDALEAGGGETGAAFADQLSRIQSSMGDLGDRLTKLDSTLSGIESRVASLEGERGTVPDSVRNSLDEINSALDTMKGEVGALKQAVQDQGQSLRGDIGSTGDKLSALEGRVSELESRPVQTGEKIAAMVLALGQVEQALNAGRPYRDALDRLKLLTKDDAVISTSSEIAILSRWTDHGIPDRLELRRRFEELAPGIDQALAGTKDDTWLQAVWKRISGLVTIRRIDSANPTPIARAEQALDEGDLVAAADAFKGQGSLGPQGEAWLNLVKARIDVERAIRQLYGKMIAPLAGETASNGATGQ